VECTATDQAGNSSVASFKVVVVDTMSPSLSLPADIVKEAMGPDGAIATFAVTAADVVDTSVDITCSQTSGATFALGTTQVECIATDDAGNKATGSFSVTVEDTTPPSLTLPDDIVKEAEVPAGAVVAYSTSASDLVDGPIAPTCTPASGSTFALGDTTVICTATEAAGNDSPPETFTVTVEDRTGPTVTVPADISVAPTGIGGAAVTYAATATDLVDGSVTPTCTPQSGTTFFFGATTVTCTATDSRSNTSTATFKVTVGALGLKGFYQPVDGGGVWNTVKNGSTVPFKFEVFAGTTELTSTAAVTSFASTTVACSTSAEDQIEEFTTTGATSLRYDTTSGQFVQNWQTPKKPGTCSKVTMTAVDGSSLSALFKLK